MEGLKTMQLTALKITRKGYETSGKEEGKIQEVKVSCPLPCTALAPANRDAIE